MSLVLVGLSHRTAPVDVRERHSPTDEVIAACHDKLLLGSDVLEAAFLRTCNRTELIADVRDPEEGAERLFVFLRDDVGDGNLEWEHCYAKLESDAVAHVLRVASSLDSMVLGEAQILGQIKGAYRLAVERHGVGPILHRLFQRAFRAAKRVRSETGLGGATVSVARVGVQLASEVFESLDDKRVLVIGAGDMAESALHGLRDAGVRDVVVLNRSPEAAALLAGRFSGTPAPLGALDAELSRADIAVASAHVSEPLITVELLDRVIRRRRGRPLLLVDLGLPRNVDAGVNELESAYLYDIDDLESVAERGLEARRAAARDAEAIIAAEVESFDRWRARLGVAATIRDLVDRVQNIATEEARRRAVSAATGSPDEERAARERVASAIVAKLLHRPLERLQREAEEGEGAYYADAVRDLFGLDEADPEDSEP